VKASKYLKNNAKRQALNETQVTKSKTRYSQETPHIYVPYLGTESSLFMSKEVQPVLPLGKPRDINIVQSL